MQAKAFNLEKNASDFPVVSAGAEEMAAEQPAEQPAELPATGAPVSPMVLVGLVLGLSSLGTGLAMRRRQD